MPDDSMPFLLSLAVRCDLGVSNAGDARSLLCDLLCASLPAGRPNGIYLLLSEEGGYSTHTHWKDGMPTEQHKCHHCRTKNYAANGVMIETLQFMG